MKGQRKRVLSAILAGMFTGVLVTVPNTAGTTQLSSLQSISNTLTAKAENGETLISEDWNFIYAKYDTYVVIVSGIDTHTRHLEIPSEIDGLPVTTIGHGAWASNEVLQSITIPNTVTSIQQSAFENCFNLEEVKLENGLIAIGDMAFQGCKDLKSIELPDSVATLGQSAFNSCTSLESVKMSRNLGDIPDKAFNDTNIRSIEIYQSTRAIHDKAFQDCKNLREVTIHTMEDVGNLLMIYNDAFIGCNSLYAIRIDGKWCKASLPNPKDFSRPDILTVYTDSDFTDKYDFVCKAYDAPVEQVIIGDVNGDSLVDAVDATAVLSEYSTLSTGNAAEFTAKQQDIADINLDGLVDAVDATTILSYYSYLSTGGDNISIESYKEIMKQQSV